MISIIIPVYNVEDYLPACMDALFKQTYTDFEILLINDGSTDGSGALCDRYAAQDTRIRVWHLENGGVSNARNVGLRNAHGDYIAFCDADDEYHPSYFKKMVSTATETNVDMVICDFFCKEKENVFCQYPAEESRHVTMEEVFARIFLRNQIGGFVWNKLFRRECIRNLSFQQDMQICEDTYFVIGALQNSQSIYYLCEPLYYYRLRENSAVNRVDNLITADGKSKFTDVFERICKDYALSGALHAYVQCGIFWMAASLKCDYINHGNKLPHVIRNLNKDARRTIKYYWRCEDLTLKQKIITTGNWLLNLRRLKKLRSSN